MLLTGLRDMGLGIQSSLPFRIQNRTKKTNRRLRKNESSLSIRTLLPSLDTRTGTQRADRLTIFEPTV